MTDASAGIEILVDGFVDNPVISWIFQDETTRPEALATWFGFWVEVYGDRAVMDVEGDGEGAALWAPPGTPALDDAQTGALVGIVQRYNGDRTGLVLGTLGSMTPPAEPHWYLNGIAARRGARGRGVGARLLEPFLARADAEGVPIYLESSNPRNLTFYRRYGFEDHGAPLDLPGAGPILLGMWRPAGRPG